MSRQLHGFKAWLIQRVSAIYLAVYFIFLFAYLMFYPPENFQMWRDWVAHPAISISITLFVLSLAIHAWVGMRDIFFDYIKPVGLKLALISVLALALLASVFWALQAIILLQVGGGA
jgi:succinate dehydrogenase / fumarate reductase, membrane anchor subunit